MAIVRLINGSDMSVKLSLEEVRAKLGNGSDFVELPGDDGPLLIRPNAVIALIEDARRGTAGFRIGAGAGSS
jgi:Trm5-related predicted tRNA methylase